MKPKWCEAIFIVGNSRSGTTMMGRVLSRDPAIYTFKEIHFWGELWACEGDVSISEIKAERLMARLMCIQRDGYLNQGDAKRFAGEAKAAISSMQLQMTPANIYKTFLTYETLKEGKAIPCEQTGRNLYFINEILQAFPNARIINMIRDPRDIFLSQKKKWKRSFMGDDIPLKETFRTWVNYHSITMSKLWNVAIRTAERIEDVRLLTVRFEDILENPKDEIAKICNFLGISFNSNMLDVPQVGSSNMPDRFHNGIRKDVSGRWKHDGLNPADIFICQKINHQLMNKYGYSAAKVEVNLLTLIYRIVSFPFHLLFALILNLKKVRSFKEIGRRLGKIDK